MAEEVMLSTIDNPYNPFDNFDQWYTFDEMRARQENRPTCCSYLARVDYSSDEVSEAEQIQTINSFRSRKAGIIKHLWPNKPLENEGQAPQYPFPKGYTPGGGVENATPPLSSWRSSEILRG